MIQLSDLVTDLETSIKLRDAGLKIDTVFVHTRFHQSDDEPPIDKVSIHDEFTYESSSIEVLAPAYTAQELAAFVYSHTNIRIIYAIQDRFKGLSPQAATEPNRWAADVLNLIEKQIITIKPSK